MIAQITNKTGGMKVIIFWILSLLAILVGIIHASSLSFVNDDAFISFRYAKNLVNGFGLVYNAGERVEGYTNFLWTIIMALGMKMNIDPVTFSISLGIFFYTCNLILFIFLSWRHQTSVKERYIFMPLTALILCVHRDFSGYATSGLETSMFTFLVSAGFATLLLGKSIRMLIGAGIILVLATLTRPDGVLFIAVSVLYLLITRKNQIKATLYFLLPLAAILLPYWIWRYNYYGYFFPNTFYAKSIDLPYYSQGLSYVYLYLQVYYSIILLFILGIILVWRGIKNLLRDQSITSIRKQIQNLSGNPQPVFLAILFVFIYTVFIIRIGGDFMHARFFIPITPLIYFILEQLINKLTSNRTILLLSVLTILTTIFRNDIYEKEINVGYVVDEIRFYSIKELDKIKKLGATLHKCFHNLPVRVAFWGTQLRLIYYADPPYAIESQAGLTDPGLAHQSVSVRGRPGHEKSATLTYLQEKRVHFFIGPASRLPMKKPFQLDIILFDSIFARIIIYDDAIMSELSQYPEVKFVRLTSFLDNYINKINQSTTEQIEQDYKFFNEFYFRFNSDTLRENKLLRHIGKQNLR